MQLPSLSEHDLLLMWVELLVIVAVARTLGAAARRVGQPRVVGELVAGVLLGPSVLAKLWPGAGHMLVPQQLSAAAPINAIGWVGVAFLLVLTGFETDLKLIRRLGRPAALVAVGGLLVPFAAGFGVGVLMPASLHGGHGTQTAFVLFIAVALSISSLPVIAKILDELGLMRRDFAQITIAVGMLNDLVGWLALGIIATLGRSTHLKPITVILPIAAIALILLLAFTVGQRGVDAALRRVRRRDGTGVDAMAVTLVVTFVFAVATQAAKSDAVLGAYIAGILLGRSRFFQDRIRVQLQSVTMAVFAPVFFTTAGLRIDLGTLGNPTALMWAGVVLAVAVASKVLGAAGGARVARLSGREGLALGVGLNCRGAVEVVIATVGLTLGVLNPTSYTAIVLMAILTSVMAPPLLRTIVHRWHGSDAEQRRLRHEEAVSRNVLIRPGRILMPTRGGRGAVATARILDAAWPTGSAITILAADGSGSLGRPELAHVLSAFGEREVEVRHVSGRPIDAVLAEAKLGYSVLGVAARDDALGPETVGPIIDDLLSECPLPIVIVRPGRRDPDAGNDGAKPRAFRRALVPVSGTLGSRAAQELCYALARQLGTDLALTHVINRPITGVGDGSSVETLQAQRQATAAAGVMEQAISHAVEHEVAAHASVRSGAAPGEEILAEATDLDADLVVLGTLVRRLEGRAFLGHTVEHVLHYSDATVVVVALPAVLAVADLAGQHH